MTEGAWLGGSVFSGIVEAVGVVRRRGGRRDGPERVVVAAPFAAELALGQSVAIDGACLTVCGLEDGAFAVEAVSSTLERTIMGRYEVGTRVNLERSLALGARIDGHWVQGHVDGRALLREGRRDAGARFLVFRLPDDVLAMTALHGSIALNGVSLTVNRLVERGCEVAVIPHTWAHTNFSDLRVGDEINVEADLIGRYVARAVELHAAGRAP